MRFTKPLTWRDNPLMLRITEDARRKHVSVPSDQVPILRLSSSLCRRPKAIRSHQRASGTKAAPNFAAR
jgi:hypothetical protein